MSFSVGSPDPTAHRSSFFDRLDVTILCCKSRFAVIATSAALAVVVCVVGAWLALSHVPRFYRHALDTEEVRLRQGNDELLECATALVNTVRHLGEWYVVLTEEQVNGWLAIDLAQNHRELLPENVVDIRAHFENDCAMIACSYRYPGLSTIVSAKVDVYLAEPHVIALRIHGARAGAIPVPITPLVETIGQVAEKLNLRVEWRQAHGDPVALVTLPETHRESTIYRLDVVQLREAAIYLAGRTESLSTPTVEPQTDVAQRPDENRNVQ